MGHRVLSEERIHSRPENVQGFPASEILVNPGETGRNVGGACRWTVDRCPNVHSNGRLIAAVERDEQMDADARERVRTANLNYIRSSGIRSVEANVVYAIATRRPLGAV